MLGGRKKELLKRVLAFVVALTMVVTLVDMTTVIALAKEETGVATEAVIATPVENGSLENQVEESIDDVDDSTIAEVVENPVEETTEEELTEEEEKSLLESLEESVEEAVKSIVSKDYKDFTENEIVADLNFGTDVKAETVYSEESKMGFDKVEYPTEAKGWSSNIYYPRELVKTTSDSSYVKDAAGSLAISSKVWTETESTGYGVYTYENTSVFEYDTENADYLVDVTFVNPTDKEYTAYVKAEDITKASGVSVKAGGNATASFVACLVDGQLSLKFLSNSDATKEASAALNTVYVSKVKITRLATNEQYTGANGVKKPTVFVASDSTVQSYEAYYNPQTGWGQVLAEFFGDGQYQEVTSAKCGYSQAKTYETSTVVVENRAIGGRSSSSFITEGKLDDLLEDVAPGDYLLVQWGHNDATYSRPNRYVSTTYDTDKDGVGDFEEWMQYYIDGAIQRGAIPVLVTPVARYSYTTDNNGNLISYASNFEAYRQVMIKMSKEQGIALVDLTQRSIDIANTFGIEGGKSLWLWTSAGDYVGAYAGGSSDSTHLQWYGAYKFAQAVAKGITEAGNSEVYSNENFSSNDNKKALKELANQIDLRAATSAPGAVQNLTAGTVGASSVSISWTADSNSELYHIYRAEVESEEAAKNFKFADDAEKYSVSRAAKFTDSRCAGGKTYVYAVRGFNSLGLGEYSENLVVTTKDAGLRFDFNYNDSATQYGWIGVKQNQLYDKDLGYGWSEKSYPNNGRSRGNNGTVSDELADMAGDFNLGAGVFCIDLPNGDYEITVYAADLLSGTSTIKTEYTAEGAVIGGCSCKQSLASVTAQVRVADGQLNLGVGGTNAYINGLTITEILKAPTGLAESEVSVVNGKYTSLLAFNPVEEAEGYSYYVKGSTDAEFKLERTFTKETYLEGVTVYGAISVNLGENYEYYVTCYTADGTESAPSNIVTVKALLDVDAPLAPKNLVCLDPTLQTSELQTSITIGWDAAEVVDPTYPVIKYIVYRSDKAEDDRAFVEYTKIGETTELTFTDDNGVVTNIPYYYKVCASNAGGAGELSDFVKTPVTGKLTQASKENLTDRALTAIALSEAVKGYSTSGEEITKGVYLSWRAFEEEFSEANKLQAKFTVYCNGKEIATGINATNMIYEGGKAGDVFKVVGSDDANVNGGLKVVETKARDNQYIEYALNQPEAEAVPTGEIEPYTANDMSVGDVDGDGVLELIVKWIAISYDNSKGGYTNPTIIDTYDIDWTTSKATLLSRIDLGVNIRSGAHYTQFQVWDFDGDGKAEIAVKTADGSTSYDGKLNEVAYVGACSAKDLPVDTVSAKNDYRNSSGYVLSGPEYFSIFNLEDGTKAADDVAYTPGRGNVSAWGDAYGNRVDRFLSATAYLDGVHPFAVMCRGYYTRTALTAYGMKDTDDDKIGDTIFELWAYDTDNGDGPKGQGNHNLSVADVDNDGKDEIVYGSSCYDHDGTLKYATYLGHGDAMHVSDWISWNDGLEVMEVHEEANQKYQVEIHDAETGEMLIGYPVANADVGRGVAADIDPTSVDAEFWASKAADGSGTGEWDSIDSAVYGTAKSSTSYWDVLTAGSTPAVNAMIYWDGDLLAEVQDHKFEAKNGYYPIATLIADWDYEKGVQNNLLYTDEIFTSNGTKGNLGLIADLTGDWREEFIARCSKDNSHIRYYSTTYVTDYVIPCFLDNLQYREGVAWENVAYNQPTHTDYLISKGLVTSEISEGKLTTDSVELQFTKACDGTLYGHDITGYAIYRNDELIDTVDLDDLKTTLSSGEGGAAKPEEVTRKNYFSFDFGAADVAEGYTQVTSKDEYTADKGYGFTELAAAGDKTFDNWKDDALLGDSVLFYDKTNTTKEFKVDIPNGTYKLTYTVAGNNYYNAITAEGKSIETNKFRCGAAAAANTVEAEVTVEDGQLNIASTVSKNNYFNIIFTAIQISETDAEFEARQAKYEAELEKYEALHKEQEATAKYVYVDKNLESNTAYSYKVAAVVDGKPSFRSKAVSLTTLISIASVKDFELDDIVEGTKVETDATELLPATVTVIDDKGAEQQAKITWDITGLDINTPGDYQIKGQVAGYDEILVKNIAVVPNAIKGISEFEDVSVIVGSASVELPTTVSVEYTNGSKNVVKVTWDTTELDLTKLGSYEITGTLEGYEQTAKIVVNVKEDYPVSVATTTIEVPVGKKIVDYLPATVVAKMASGKTAEVAVTWKTEGVDAINTSAPSQQMIHGTVEGLNADILLDVVVNYPVVAKFDFGIKDETKAEGWTTVTVNAKGGKKTNAQLGIQYTAEKGYGFTTDDGVIEGRQETVEGSALYPTNVATDFALMTGQTFVVDVENGNYLVYVMTNCGIGSTSATVEVEGVSASFSANKSYTVKEYSVAVEDGQLTITDKSSLARIGAIVIRKSHTHTPGEATVENKVEATCTKAGSYDTVVRCSECGEEISRTSIEIPLDAKSHGETEIKEENRVEPSCEEAGSYDSVTYCKACGEVVSTETVTLEALGHEMSEAVVEKATPHKAGRIYTYCTREGCGAILSDEVIAAVKEASLNKYTYSFNGKTHQPVVKVVDTDGKELAEGTDFTVEYSGNGKHVGAYKATITLTGNYEGELVEKYYVLTPIIGIIVGTITNANDTVKSAVETVATAVTGKTKKTAKKTETVEEPVEEASLEEAEEENAAEIEEAEIAAQTEIESAEADEETVTDEATPLAGQSKNFKTATAAGIILAIIALAAVVVFINRKKLFNNNN